MDIDNILILRKSLLIIANKVILNTHNLINDSKMESFRRIIK